MDSTTAVAEAGVDLDGALPPHASHCHAAASQTTEDALRLPTATDCRCRMLQVLSRARLLIGQEGVATGTATTAAAMTTVLLALLPAGAGVPQWVPYRMEVPGGAEGAEGDGSPGVTGKTRMVACLQ